jgi:membrane-bound serine protease (ClpP class)
LIIGGLALFFLLDELLVIFVLRGFYPHVFPPAFLTMVVGSAGALSLLLAWLVFRALRIRPSTGSEGLIGKRGRALSPVFGQGEVFIHGEIWRAMSDEEIQEGDVIEVTRVDGLALTIRKVSP